MPKKKENVEVKKVVQEEGTILVTRTTVVSGKEVESESSQELTKIKVRPFLCQPAYVSFKAGETIPLVQSYAGRRIDVNISHPCYKEEILDVLKDVAVLTNSVLEDEAVKITNAAIPRILKNKAKAAKKTDKPKAAKKKEAKPAEEEKDDLDDLLGDEEEPDSPLGEDPDDDDDLRELL